MDVNLPESFVPLYAAPATSQQGAATCVGTVVVPKMRLHCADVIPDSPARAMQLPESEAAIRI